MNIDIKLIIQEIKYLNNLNNDIIKVKEDEKEWR